MLKCLKILVSTMHQPNPSWPRSVDDIDTFRRQFQNFQNSWAEIIIGVVQTCSHPIIEQCHCAEFVHAQHLVWMLTPFNVSWCPFVLFTLPTGGLIGRMPFGWLISSLNRWGDTHSADRIDIGRWLEITSRNLYEHAKKWKEASHL